jgi:RNA polymerase sigma-70 factor, ECF subfamily
MPDQNDDVLAVVRCLRGDSSAFEAIVARYQRVVLSVARRILGHYDDALDATQNTFIRAYQHLDTYDPDRPFFSWLYRIAINECLNAKRARRPGEPLEDVRDESSTALQTASEAERSAVIDSALLKLSEEHRLVLALRHFAELSYSEIADVLGVPEKTVKSRLFEARQRLRDLLRAKPGVLS